MTTIDLNDLQEIPKEFLDQLQSFNQFFKENRFLDKLLNNNSILTLIEKINEHCLNNRIFGYHYTKAIPLEIQKTGLICRKGEEIRNTFIQNFGDHFTTDEKLKIKNVNMFFKKPNSSIRFHKTWQRNSDN